LKVTNSTPTPPEIQTSAGPCSLSQLKMWGLLLHQSVQSRLEKDVLDTTPQRITDMLCPDLTPAEFKGVRRRVYDTVMLGKGLKIDDGTDDIPVANTAQGVHDIEKVSIFLLLLYEHVTTYIKVLPSNYYDNHTIYSFVCHPNSLKNAKSAEKTINLLLFLIGKMEMSFAVLVELFTRKASCTKEVNSVSSKAKSTETITETWPIHSSVHRTI